MKKSFRKGCHFFATHMEETTRDKMTSFEDHLVLRYFTDVFEEIPGLPPKRDINFSIYLVPGVQDTLQIGHTRIERVAYVARGDFEEGVYMPNCVPLGSPSSFCE
jgi:hypothetical protein